MPHSTFSSSLLSPLNPETMAISPAVIKEVNRDPGIKTYRKDTPLSGEEIAQELKSPYSILRQAIYTVLVQFCVKTLTQEILAKQVQLKQYLTALQAAQHEARIRSALTAEQQVDEIAAIKTELDSLPQKKSDIERKLQTLEQQRQAYVATIPEQWHKQRMAQNKALFEKLDKSVFQGYALTETEKKDLNKILTVDELVYDPSKQRLFPEPVIALLQAGDATAIKAYQQKATLLQEIQLIAALKDRETLERQNKAINSTTIDQERINRTSLIADYTETGENSIDEKIRSGNIGKLRLPAGFKTIGQELQAHQQSCEGENRQLREKQQAKIAKIENAIHEQLGALQQLGTYSMKPKPGSVKKQNEEEEKQKSYPRTPNPFNTRLVPPIGTE